MHNLLRASSIFACAMVVASVATHAQTISDVNIFTGATATPSNEYNEGIFPKADVNDSSSAQFYFSDTSADSVLTFTGLNDPLGIDQIRFYDGEKYQVARVATQVTVSSSLDGITFTPNGTFTLTTGPGGYYNGGVDSNVAASYPGYGPSGDYATNSPSTTPGYGSFDTIAGLGIVANASAVRLDFGPAQFSVSGSQTVGQGFTEIQGFAGVPEPSTYGMMFMGCAGLLVLVRRYQALKS